MKHSIVCIGEILWDSVPSGLFLGGAPFNAGYHLRHLGHRVSFISRVGDDILGKEALKRVRRSGLNEELIQLDHELNTGFVDVEMGSGGIPQYTIRYPAAWDKIEFNEDIQRAIEGADAILFGTLAQRSETSRKTIQSAGLSKALKILDLNLRTPYGDKQITENALKMANILKVNEEELDQLQRWFKLSGGVQESILQLVDQFLLETICMTRGGEGSLLFTKGTFYERDGIKVEVEDTIGAGDAFLSALISGFLSGAAPGQILENANRFGAYVATKPGATPDYPVRSFNDISLLSLSGEDLKSSASSKQ